MSALPMPSVIKRPKIVARVPKTSKAKASLDLVTVLLDGKDICF